LTSIPPENEWHRSEHNEKILRDLCHRVYGPDVTVGIAHHICIYNSCDGSLIKEWPSAETLLFDHWVAWELWGKHFIDDYLQPLSTYPTEQRLSVLAGWLYEKEKKDEKAKRALQKQATKAGRPNRK
jgi:hypothetical protein